MCIFPLNEKAVHYETTSMSISTRNNSTSETLIELFTTSTSANACQLRYEHAMYAGGREERIQLHWLELIRHLSDRSLFDSM